MNIKGHFETITRHKLLVMKYCFACGLYEQGLAHDLSKYSPTEFIPGCIYYQGDHSPNEAERLARGYSSAWLHHKGRNKHHLEYWIDYSINKTGLDGMKMPLRYVCEMVCDRVAASQIYLGDKYTDASPWEYYERSKTHYLLHPETRALLEELLKMVRDLGHERTFEHMKYLRKRLLKGIFCLKTPLRETRRCFLYAMKKHKKLRRGAVLSCQRIRRSPKTVRTCAKKRTCFLFFLRIDVAAGGVQ